MGCNASTSVVTPLPIPVDEATDLWAMKPTNFADKRRKSNGTAPCFTRDNSGLNARAGDVKLTPNASVDIVNVNLAVPSTPVLKPGSVLVMGSASSSKKSHGTETVTPCSSVKTSWSSSSKELLMSDYAKRKAMRRPSEVIVVEDSWYPAARPNLRIQVRR